MSSNVQFADPVAKGILPTAKQSFRDLFHWKQRVVVTNGDGETHTEWQSPEPLRNPFSLLAMLKAKDWLYFIVGFIAWTADAFDFHALSIQTTKFAKYYGTTNTAISTAITLTLLLRSVGAAIFGLIGDRYGRKWPMVLNMFVLGLLQIGTIYADTYQKFLAVRSIFGLFMGGVYGNAVAMALENCPNEARGLVSGVMQQGYSFGYVLAAIANLAVGGGVETWKTVFWAGAGLSFASGILRVFFAESQQFIEAKKSGHKITASDFWSETKAMLRTEWRMCVYCVILMSWFNFYSHTSQDSYTTFVLTQKELSNSAASRASILMKTGAVVGGPISGYFSQWLGRRRAIIGAAIISGFLIPAWILSEGERALSVTAFFMQFFVQGAWGIIPVHLSELSPSAYRSTFPGLTYQLGNAISSPSTEIVNALAESNQVRAKSGALVDAYGPVMAIATAIIVTGIVFTTALGPERRGRAFEGGPIGTNIHHDEEKNAETVSIDEKTYSGENRKGKESS
ncbi:carboxylic acid transport protein [Xylariaceae sp. FL1272]|nr:carboxylic acid transport protein [Xylariaceae sp. FL1272]